MWKYAVVFIGVALVAGKLTADLMTAYHHHQQRQALGSLEALPLSEHLVAAAASANKRRGMSKGPGTFVGADVIGTSLILTYQVRAPARKISPLGVSRVRRKMVGKLCEGEFIRLLRKGGGVIFRYQTRTGRTLMDPKVTLIDCRTTT